MTHTTIVPRYRYGCKYVYRLPVVASTKFRFLNDVANPHSETLLNTSKYLYSTKFTFMYPYLGTQVPFIFKISLSSL
eukprot:SAG31_NODE_9483_length_1270_cov_0.872758_2_plen_77_part_00